MKKKLLFLLIGFVLVGLVSAGMFAGNTLKKPDIAKDITSTTKARLQQDYNADSIKYSNCYKKNNMNYCDLKMGDLEMKNFPLYHDGEKSSYDEWGNPIGSYTDDEMLEKKTIGFANRIGVEEKEVKSSLEKEIKFNGEVNKK